MHLTTTRNRNDQSQNNRVRNSIQGNLIQSFSMCVTSISRDVIFMCDVTFRGVKSPCSVLIQPSPGVV